MLKLKKKEKKNARAITERSKAKAKEALHYVEQSVKNCSETQHQIFIITGPITKSNKQDA